MARGFYNHIWYKLLDEDGVPVPSASVYIYEYNSPTTQLNLFDSNGDSVSQPLQSNSSGVFDFYVKDNMRNSNDGYDWHDRFIISWSLSDKSGIIDGDNLFGEFKIANINGSDTAKNKTISNYIGWILENHINENIGE